MKILIVAIVLALVGCSARDDTKTLNDIKTIARNSADIGVSCGLNIGIECATKSIALGKIAPCMDYKKLQEQGVLCVKGYMPSFYAEEGK